MSKWMVAQEPHGKVVVIPDVTTSHIYVPRPYSGAHRFVWAQIVKAANEEKARTASALLGTSVIESGSDHDYVYPTRAEWESK